MSDDGEGRGSLNLMSDTYIRDAVIGGVRFRDVAFSGPGTAIRVGTTIDFNMFCASIGNYQHDRHLAIIEGNESYPANPTYTSFLVLHAGRLMHAIHALGVHFWGSAGLYHRQVDYYTHRDALLTPAEVAKGLSREAINAYSIQVGFRKPGRFALEQEYRIGTFPRNHGEVPCNVIYSRDAPEGIQALFRAAIYSEGCDYPRSRQNG